LELGGLAACLLDPLLDQRVESMEVKRPVVLGIAIHLYCVILEGCDLSLELLVEQSQLLLLLKNVLAIKSHLLPLTIRLHMLFLHLFSHLIEHLKELIFVLVR